MESKIAVLFVAHMANSEIVERYRVIRNKLSSCLYDVIWIVADNDFSLSYLPNDIYAIKYTSADIDGLNYSPITNRLIPGSPHFIPLRFFLDHKQYSAYWFIEYDVVYTGNWHDLISDCDTNLGNYDFLSCHVERYGDDNRNWPWWYSGNNCGYGLADSIKGFNPICRYSNNALTCLDNHQRKGFSAHSEVMVTTCLYNHGMKIGNIGGFGEFTPDGYRNKYYVKDIGVNNGTMRWRPTFTQEEVDAFGMKDKLFHPIKGQLIRF